MLNPIPPNDFEDKLIQSFSKHVRSYDKNAQLQKTMAERLAAFLPDPLPKPVLEIGCGTGIFTRHLLARNCKKLILNDIAPAMIDHLKTQLKLPESTLFYPGNAESENFPKAKLIAANAVFQWFQKANSTLLKFNQLLPKDGKLLFSTFGPETLQEFRDTGGIAGPTHLLSLDEWNMILQRAGFQIEGTEVESRQIFFENTRNLVKNLQQIGAAPLQILKPMELRRLIQNYDENFTTPQGVYTHWELIYFSTVKK